MGPRSVSCLQTACVRTVSCFAAAHAPRPSADVAAGSWGAPRLAIQLEGDLIDGERRVRQESSAMVEQGLGVLKALALSDANRHAVFGHMPL